MLVSPTPGDTAARSNPAPSSRTSNTSPSPLPSDDRDRAGVGRVLRGVLHGLQAAEVDGVLDLGGIAADPVRVHGRRPAGSLQRGGAQGLGQPPVGQQRRVHPAPQRLDLLQRLGPPRRPGRAAARGRAHDPAGSGPPSARAGCPAPPAAAARRRAGPARSGAAPGPHWPGCGCATCAPPPRRPPPGRSGAGSQRGERIGGHRPEEVGLLQKGGVVDQARPPAARSRAPRSGSVRSPGSGGSQRPTLPVDPALRAVGPVDDLQRRVADRVRQDRPELFPVEGTAGRGAQPLQRVRRVQAALEADRRGTPPPARERRAAIAHTSASTNGDSGLTRRTTIASARTVHRAVATDSTGSNVSRVIAVARATRWPIRTRDRQEQEHGQQLPDGHHHVAHEGRLGADQERVGGTARLTRRVLARDRKAARRAAPWAGRG